MLSYRLIRVIEYHSDALTANLVRKVLASDRTTAYRTIPSEELKQRVREIYHHLGTWLMDKRAPDVELRYTAIGSRLAEQGVPLSELIWAISLTKQTICEYLEDVTFPGHINDMSDRLEILHLLGQFFDEAIHAAAVGYEWAAEAKSKIKKTDKPVSSEKIM